MRDVILTDYIKFRVVFENLDLKYLLYIHMYIHKSVRVRYMYLGLL